MKIIKFLLILCLLGAFYGNSVQAKFLSPGKYYVNLDSPIFKLTSADNSTNFEIIGVVKKGEMVQVINSSSEPYCYVIMYKGKKGVLHEMSISQTTKGNNKSQYSGNQIVSANNQKIDNIIAQLNKLVRDYNFLDSRSYYIYNFSFSEPSGVLTINLKYLESSSSSNNFYKFNLDEINTVKSELYSWKRGSYNYSDSAVFIRCKYEDCITADKKLVKSCRLKSGSNTLDKKLVSLINQLKNINSSPSQIVSLQTPVLSVSNVTVSDPNNNQMIESEEVVYLNFNIKNTGNLKASNVKVLVRDLNYTTGLSFDKEVLVGTVEIGSTEKVSIKLITTNKAKSANALLQVVIIDDLQEYGKPIQMGIPIYIQPQQSYTLGMIPDTDLDIPKTTAINSNTYCLIIGNEDYNNQASSNQISDVSYAINDADVFYEYMTHTMGIPSKNITTLKNASTSEINQGINKLSAITKVLRGKNSIILYYAGHGLPDEQTREPILIPVDVTSVNRESGVLLNDMLVKLNENNPQRIIAFVDACFSGGSRTENLASNERGVRIVPKAVAIDKTSNTVVFTSSSGTESSYAYPEQRHGMFTYYVLKKFKETKGQVTLSELDSYLETEVALNSILINNYQQTPMVIYSLDVKDSWINWRLIEP